MLYDPDVSKEAANSMAKLEIAKYKGNKSRKQLRPTSLSRREKFRAFADTTTPFPMGFVERFLL
jgi:hypothetical protein